MYMQVAYIAPLSFHQEGALMQVELTEICRRYDRLYTGAIADMLDKKGLPQPGAALLHYSLYSRQPDCRSRVYGAWLSMRHNHKRRHQYPPGYLG